MILVFFPFCYIPPAGIAPQNKILPTPEFRLELYFPSSCYCGAGIDFRNCEHQKAHLKSEKERIKTWFQEKNKKPISAKVQAAGAARSPPKCGIATYAPRWAGFLSPIPATISGLQQVRKAALKANKHKSTGARLENVAKGPSSSQRRASDTAAVAV